MKANASFKGAYWRIQFLAVLVFAAGIAIANAGPQPMESKTVAVPPAEPFNWTGFYIGGNIGGTWSDYRLGAFVEDVEVEEQFGELQTMFASQPEGDQAIFDSVFEKFDGRCLTEGSVFGGGQVGYNHQFGHLVFGIEADFDGLDTSVRRHESFDAEQVFKIFGADTHVEATRSASTDWNASVRLRAGYACNRLLFYLTGGGAFADVQGTADDIAVTDFSINGQFSIKGQPIGTVTSTNRSSHCHVLAGWTGGLGTEFAVNTVRYHGS